MTEQYTLDIEILLDIFLDGLMSGVSTALMNTVMGVDQAREEAAEQISNIVNDPAVMETFRDLVRVRINGTGWTRRLIGPTRGLQ